MTSTGSGGMMMSKPQSSTRNQEATIYIGNLDEKVTESLLWELMVQVGPVVHVHIPRDRVTQQHQGYGFCEFQTEEDADYAVKIMNSIKLFGKPIRINKSSMDKKSLDVGANLFIGNLAPDVDEKLLFDTFILFGTLIQTPKVSRDEATGVSKGYGFVSFDCFESSDAALESMNGQYLCNRPITVNYAFKKDGKGERHGSPAERLLAAQTRKAALAAAAASGVPLPGSNQLIMQQVHMQMQQQQQQQLMHPGMMYHPSAVPANMYYNQVYPVSGNPLMPTQPAYAGYYGVPMQMAPHGYPMMPIMSPQMPNFPTGGYPPQYYTQNPPQK